MRILEFNVQGQILTKTGDFNNIVAGSKGYLYTRFNFSTEWQSLKKIAVFIAGGKETYIPLDCDKCEIPAEVLQYNKIGVIVVGKGTDTEIRSTGVEFGQIGGK